jgi:hypothetical protein
LAGTVIGEVLFQADYLMKELCLGEKALPAGVRLPSIFEQVEVSGSNLEVASRQWFVMEAAEVTQTKDGVLIPAVKLGVQARRLVKTKTGYEDAPSTDPKEPAVLFAKNMTDQFPALAKAFPVFGELVAVAKAVALAQYLAKTGCSAPDRQVLQQVAQPRPPAFFGYQATYGMKIPTLSKSINKHDVQVDGGAITVQEMMRCVHGGVDLSVPKVQKKDSQAVALPPVAKVVEHPFFKTAAPARAA